LFCTVVRAAGAFAPEASAALLADVGYPKILSNSPTATIPRLKINKVPVVEASRT
jgi:hypothetical protein